MPPGVTDDEIRESYYKGTGQGKDSVSFKNKDVQPANYDSPSPRIPRLELMSTESRKSQLEETRDHPQEENLVSFAEIIDIDTNLKNEFEMNQKFNMEYIHEMIDELSTEKT